MADESQPGSESAITARPTLKPMETLQESHKNALVRAIANICETQSAKTAFAQILDGFPTLPHIDDGIAPSSLPQSHPSHTRHLELCEGIMENLAEFRASYNVQKLALDSEAMTQYNSAAPDSRLFNTKLIELTVRTTHQIAVDIAASGGSRHKDDELGTWAPPDSDELFWHANPGGPPPTWFHLVWYKDSKQYPNGSGDMAGYWAENQIFGGVVLFDRRSPGGTGHKDFVGPVDPDGIYLHPQKSGVTYRIYKLLDVQKARLVDFLRADTKEALQICPLPLEPDENNLERVDPEEPITETGIYRDKWERLPFPDDQWDCRSRDVLSRVDYPRFSDYQAARRRAREREARIHRQWRDKHA